MKPLENTSNKNDILIRLRRIEGQVKGLQRMINNSDKCCSDILIQIAAIRAAINKVGILIFEEHSKGCLKSLNSENNKVIDELIKDLNRFLKYQMTE
ncbi:MAG: metal-sensitive transcriptional regulator [Peptococcaceae bacterium]|nr:metal-sensitive transcriptional regulator [Peptococcaceae bacterium]